MTKEQFTDLKGADKISALNSLYKGEVKFDTSFDINSFVDDMINGKRPNI